MAERSDWFKVSQRLGSINGATGRFQPHTEPSQFDPADETKLESATEILRLYLWSAANLVKFEDVRRIYSLPKPDRVAETLTEADLASE